MNLSLWSWSICSEVFLCEIVNMKTYLKRKLKPLYLKLDLGHDRKRFKEVLSTHDSFKIVVGSSGIYEEGWIPSEIEVLNLLKEDSWANFFQPNTISNILAEHVWEHLTPADGKIGAQTCYRFLESLGRLRIAVPDGFHSDPDYIEHVKIGGVGDGADDHKVLYNYRSISRMLKEVGFEVELLEYFDEEGQFHQRDWDVEDGFVHRSLKYDDRNADGQPNYTSLIVDAIKV